MSEETIYQSVHNPNNKLLTYNDLRRIFEKAEVIEFLNEKNFSIEKFNLANIQKAFVHISYSIDRQKKYLKGVVEKEDDGVIVENCVPIQNESQERLEWLGDGILQSIVAFYIWRRFPKKDEGFYTTTRSKLVKTKALGKFSEYLGLQEFVLINKYQEDVVNGRKDLSILEDCFEAFIGALFLETQSAMAYEFCNKMVLNIIEKTIDFPMLILVNENYKDLLNKYFHKKFMGSVPIYQDISVQESIALENGKQIKKRIYTSGVLDPEGKQIAVGISNKSKKDAEQIAAKEALKLYGHKVYDKINPFLF